MFKIQGVLVRKSRIKIFGKQFILSKWMNSRKVSNDPDGEVDDGLDGLDGLNGED